MTTETYYFLSILITAIGAGVACWQLCEISSTRKKQFQQARREKTVDMIVNYVATLTKETKAIEKIVAKLNDEQCMDLYNCTPFTVELKIKEQMCDFCPNNKNCIAGSEPCKKNDDEYLVEGEMLYFMRHNVINRLNNIESVLLAWQTGIVEKDTIEEQFAFLDKKREKERALEVFRSIAGGGKAYPAIEKFYLKLDAKRNSEAQKTFKDELN